ncbi:LysR substrate-binding domain-containing protein [Leptospira sp. 96542]|nr:LysR substrate-binding domain-containing protein [Leptospira sp. 96542]
MSDLHKMRCFIAVAEELHFGKAAARLHISQPPLSQHIKTLEEALGVQLLARDRRSVRLTAAGQVYLQHAYPAVKAAEDGASAARRAAAGDFGELRIGYSASALYVDAVLQAITLYRKRHPAVELRLQEGTTRTCVADIEAGKLDMAFARGPLPAPAAQWGKPRKRLISGEPLLLALPKSHALAKQQRVALADLQGERFVALARDMRAALNELIDDVLAPLARRPDVAVETRDMASLLGLVGAGAGVALVPESVANHRFRYIVYRPLSTLTRRTRVELFQLLPQHPTPAALGLGTLLGEVV